MCYTNLPKGVTISEFDHIPIWAGYSPRVTHLSRSYKRFFQKEKKHTHTDTLYRKLCSTYETAIVTV